MTDRFHLFLLLVLFFVGLTQITDYGLSCDEPLEMGSVKFALEHALSDKPIPIDLEHYGIVFNVLSETVFQAGQYLQFGLDYRPSEFSSDIDPSDAEWVASLVEARMLIKHVLTFLLAIVTMGAAAGLAKGLLGPRAAPLTVVCVALMPRFWGHAFFNPKDIPFAAALTGGSYLGWRLINVLDSQGYEEKHSRSTLVPALGVGAFIGLATGTRIGAFLLLGFIPLAHLGARFPRGRWRAWLKQHLPAYLLMATAWFFVMILVHPAAWSEPHTWFFKTLSYLSQHAYDQEVLFQGQQIPAHRLPRTYLPHWMGITVPILWQVLACLGILALARKWRALSSPQRSALILVLLQLSTMPLVAITTKATLYDGMRQFLFVLPMIAVLSACGLLCVHQTLRSKPARVAMVAMTIAYAGWIVSSMIHLHPYQYTYFNSAAGGLKRASTAYETDYWGLSLKEGMEWINRHAAEGSDVVVGGVVYSAQIFARPDLRIWAGEIGSDRKFVSALYPFQGDVEKARLSTPYYYLAHNRFRLMRQYQECELVHRITRDEAPLSVIKRCAE